MHRIGTPDGPRHLLSTSGKHAAGRLTSEDYGVQSGVRPGKREIYAPGYKPLLYGSALGESENEQRQRRRPRSAVVPVNSADQAWTIYGQSGGRSSDSIGIGARPMTPSTAHCRRCW